MTGAVCPYCRTHVGEQSDPPEILCPGCNTPHHAECFAENGGCTIFGCSAAPAEEAKLSIATPELDAAATSAPPLEATNAASAPPPPFPDGYAIAPTQISNEGRVEAIRFSPSNTLFVPAQPAFAREISTPSFHNAPQPGAKNRTTFILLGVLFGYFGAHSFYAGFWKRGLLQAALTALTLGIAGVAIWVWALIDICTISRDSMGNNFKG